MAHSLMDIAKLAQASYKPHLIASPRVVDSLDQGHVQAHLLEDGTLLLPGSNSLLDYAHFNLRVFNVGGKKYRLASKDTERGASGTRWHQGFLIYARVVYQWVGSRKPKLIIGHSLGAAAAQILSKSWDRPAVGFAAPRPKSTGGSVAHDDKCLLICRVDDVVCSLTPGFFHLGDARFLEPQSVNWGGDHSMKNYIRILSSNKGPDKVPARWG